MQSDRDALGSATENAPLDVVTGAFGYTGGAIAQELLRRGRRVRTLTGHPSRPGADRRIESHPYSFEDPEALRRSLDGVSTFYNTYWIRFARGDLTFEQAVANSALLFAAANDAGVQRVVHVSVSNPAADSPYPYFRGKAEVEQILAATHPSWAVVRPTVIFGSGDILLNNIAWLLRRFPVFFIPGDGCYRLRPIHADDVGSLCANLGSERENRTVDAVGPDTFTFEEMVRAIREAAEVRSRLIHTQPRLAMLGSSIVGTLVRDVVLSKHELGGMMAEDAFTDSATTGARRLVDWLADQGRELGRTYASELERHFR